MDRSLQAGGRNLSLSRQFPGLLLYLSPGRDHYKLMVLMTELLLWCLTMSREILEAPNSFLQFQFNNISYPKSFVSMLCREFRWKFCILTYFALYFLQKMTQNNSPHILKYLILNISKTKDTNIYFYFTLNDP